MLNITATVAFIIFLIILFIFFIGSIVLIYHFRRFRLSWEHHRTLLAVFIIISLLFAVIEFSIFFSIDWQSMRASIENNFQDNSIPYPNDYY